MSDDMRGTYSGPRIKRDRDEPVRATLRRPSPVAGHWDTVPAEVYGVTQQHGAFSLAVLASGRSLSVDLSLAECIALRDMLDAHVSDW